MTRINPSTYWIVFLVLIGVGIELYSSHSIVHPDSISDVFSLSLPVRVEMEGRVENPRSSGRAVVFELENEGSITCYHRHPSQIAPLFPGDVMVVRARIEATPKGVLCVVEEVTPHVPA